MKVFAISDLHLSTAVEKPMDIFGGAWQDYFNKIRENWLRLVTDDDIVLIAGDISWAMTLEDALLDIKEIDKLPGKKVVIRGNHDYWWKSINRMRLQFPKNFFALQNDCIRIGKYLICGSRGWTCPDNGHNTKEDETIYLREGERIKLSLKSMQSQRKEDDIVIFMIHYPPFNAKREPSIFTNLIFEYKVDAVVYGHLHGDNCRSDKVVNYNGIRYYLTSCDQVNNKPVLIFD